jgi:cell wall-associated NlpC family hydrolase
MSRRRLACSSLLAVTGMLACVGAAGAVEGNWAAPQIRAVTQVGVLGHSPETFAPRSLLTQGALANALSVTDTLQHAAVDPTPAPTRLTLLTTIAENATVGGSLVWSVDAPGRTVDRVDFAVDGTGVFSARSAPFEETLDTRSLADGSHQLAINAALAGGGYAIATWTITVANAPGSLLSPATGAVEVPIAKSSLPAEPASPAATRRLYRAVVPARAVSIKQLDAALIGYLQLGGAARAIQQTLQRAGLQPRANTGTEAVARMLGLRINHPAAQDDLELLPSQPATRAEAAWSFARLLQLDGSAVQSVERAAETFTLPELTAWQRRLLTTAVSYVGYPYVWGGTSPTAQTLFGVHSVGGFDCSGFVWRVVKLTQYPDEAGLADVLRGRTTYDMSGEVPRSSLVPAAKLQPADIMFFGAHGRTSKPTEIDHAGLYLGNGWFVQSSGNGVTLLPVDGWYIRSFAWARRPLHEAGLE